MGDPGSRVNPFVKDPDSTKRTFGINWAGFLGVLTFSTSVWSVISGTVLIISNTTSTTYALVQLSGGTPSEKCALRNRVTRSDGEIDDQTIYIRISEK